MDFGQRIKELRIENDMSRKELAAKLGFKQNAIYEWEERGKETDYKTLVKLAEIFDVSIDYLLGRTDDYKRQL